jgi:hypothetical protein
VALMASSMAVQHPARRAPPPSSSRHALAFFLAAIAVLLIAYVFVRLCQYTGTPARSTSSPAPLWGAGPRSRACV